MVVEGEGSASKEEGKAMDAEEKEEKPKEEEKEVKPKEEEKEVMDAETELSTAEKDKKEEANDEEKEEVNDEEKEEVNDEEKKAEKNEMEAETEEKEDLALLSETQTAPREERSLRDRQLDKQIRSQSEEAQAAFLQGAIPKVVFQHALAGGCVERV